MLFSSIWHMFVFMYVVVIVWGSVGMFFVKDSGFYIDRRTNEELRWLV